MSSNDRGINGNAFQQINQPIFKVLEEVNMGIALIDEQGNYTFANRRYNEIYGYEDNTLAGVHFLELVPDHEKQNAIELNRVFTQTGERGPFEHQRRRKDGSKFTVSGLAKWVHLPDGHRYIMLTINDISHLKAFEKKVYQNEDTLRSLMENSAAKTAEVRTLIMNAALDAIICIDRDDVITLWNPQAEKIFGWSKEEVIGKKLSSIIIPEAYRQRHLAGIKKYVETGHGPALNVLLELQAIDREGHAFPIELTVLPIKQENEDEIFCAFIRDITERKKNETKLQELNKQMSENIEELAKSNVELEQFAYIASHDLQEPLRMVTNFLTQLNKKYSDVLDEKGLQYLTFAVDGAERMRKIILDLLEYSRIGKINAQPELVNTTDIIVELIALNRDTIAESGAEIKMGTLPEVTAVKTFLRQVFQNLIGNALKYRRPNVIPKVIVEGTEDATHWKFSVSDNGIGIEPRFYHKIFEIFQRLHSREAYSGTGIGLAICKKIVESHGGTMWIESEPGVGSTFYFTIKK